jgi:hypothetical protein
MTLRLAPLGDGADVRVRPRRCGLPPGPLVQGEAVGECNGHTDGGLGGLTGWSLWLVGHRLWEQAAIKALGAAFSADELNAVAEGGAAERLMEQYWDDYAQGCDMRWAVRRLVNRVRKWLPKRGT